MEIECDVLVIGCGPAGAAAARASALAGAKTLVVEKKEKIGEPVACGEAIGACYLGMLPFQIPEEQLLLRLDGMKIGYNGHSAERTGGIWPGYAIDRARFDKFLAHEAMQAGAKVMASTSPISMELSGNEIASVLLSFSGKQMAVSPRAVVAADGVNSGVAERLGLLRKGEGISGEIHSWEMRGVTPDSLSFDQIFIGDFVDAGYGYIFPKGNGVANVGVGSIIPKLGMEEYFVRFLEHPAVKRQVSGAEMFLEKSKSAPFGDALDSSFSGNVFFAGDAANQNIKPFVEGILPGVICGDIAGKTAAEFAKGMAQASEYCFRVSSAMPELAQSSLLAKLMLKAFKLEPERQNPMLYLLASGIAGAGEAEALLEKSAEELKSLVERG
mgnify:CR=1 FL=1